MHSLAAAARRARLPALRGRRALAQLNATRPPPGPSSQRLRRPISQPTHATHPHLLAAHDVTPGIARAEYIARRAALARRLPPGSLALFPANAQHFMSEDVPYLYHANTDLSYLVGLAEPGAVLAAHRPAGRPADADADADAGADPAAVFALFVRPRDPAEELWDGPLCGASPDVAAHFAVDAVHELRELPRFVADRLPALASFHLDPSIDPAVPAALLAPDRPHTAGGSGGGGGSGIAHALTAEERARLVALWRRDAPPKQFALPLRVRKSPAELALLRRAARLMAAGLNDAMAASHPGVPERTLEAVLRFGATSRGADRMAFPPVVAGGPRACTLHYMRNDAAVAAGQLVMVDAGCEVAGYASDVSRSWPAGGAFSPPQRDLYALALHAQRECIALLGGVGAPARPPLSLDDLHARAARTLTDGLRDLGFLRRHTTESALATRAFMRYFPHALGHYLGMDVHDTHALSKSIPLEPGMVVTVEPGLYCAPDDEEAPAAFRGIGLRIEDDVVVGGPGCEAEVLSDDAVKEIADVEALVGSAQSSSKQDS